MGGHFVQRGNPYRPSSGKEGELGTAQTAYKDFFGPMSKWGCEAVQFPCFHQMRLIGVLALIYIFLEASQ
jgi:hypothetical protein